MVTWCPTRDVSPRCLATMAVALACMDAVLIMLLHDVFGSSSGSAIWAVYPMVLNRFCEVSAHCFLPGVRHETVRGVSAEAV